MRRMYSIQRENGIVQKYSEKATLQKKKKKKEEHVSLSGRMLCIEERRTIEQMAAPVTGTTLRTTGPVPADSRQ